MPSVVVCCWEVVCNWGGGGLLCVIGGYCVSLDSLVLAFVPKLVGCV
jgi:hypothetical protein